MKRLLVLCVMVAVTFSAFGTGEPETATKAEPVTITYKAYTGPIDEERAYSQTALGKFLLDKFNVKIEIWPASETTYRTELVTDAATGSLPDLITIWVYPNTPQELPVMQKAAKEGLLAPLNAAIDKYAPTLKKAISNPKNYPMYTQEYMKDPDFKGETYFIPCAYTVGEKTPPGWEFVIRDDVRAKLGLKTPLYMDSTEQFLDILRKIKALNPVDINGRPAYATGGIRIWMVLLGTYTRLFDFGGGTGIDLDRSGKLQHFVQTDYAWQQILFMRKLLSEGLLDPESLTHTFEVGREKVAQGKYVVEPFFAAGGISYHLPTIEAKPEMSYSVMGSFYTYKGKPGPLLVNNIGMQTHFLHAVSKKANLPALMPILDFFATPEGVAANAYGVPGVHWDWKDGSAVLRPEYHKDFLSTAVPSPYRSVGAGRFNFVTTILGANNPSVMVFGGTEKPRYPLDPTFDDNVASRTALSHDGAKGLLTENGISIGSFMESYPKKDAVQQLLDMAYVRDSLLLPAYLAGSEAAARKLLDEYRASVKQAGVDDYLMYLQKIYDADSKRYIVYESMGG